MGRVEHRFRPPVHRVVACERDYVYACRVPQRGHARIDARVVAARAVVKIRLVPLLGVRPLALPQPDVRLCQHRRDEFRILIGRLVYRTDVADRHQCNLAVCHGVSPIPLSPR